MWSSRAVWAAVTMKQWGSRSLWQQRGHTASSIPFRIADFGLFRDLFGIIPGDKALERRKAQETWFILEDHILQVQE